METNVNQSVPATGHGASNVLLRMVNVRLFSSNKIIHAVALCDEASSVTLIDHSLIEELNIEGKSQPLCVQWTKQVTARHEDSVCINLTVSGNYDKAFTM
ncbi:hypothetical protein JTB14_028505 [Gonioctena quinquepunctata]|nr:hypothetical protein JTB14_028505 [Gonioctena quinquepunctata]